MLPPNPEHWALVGLNGIECSRLNNPLAGLNDLLVELNALLVNFWTERSTTRLCSCGAIQLWGYAAMHGTMHIMRLG